MMKFGRRLLASCLSLLLVMPSFASAFSVLAEDSGETAVSRYKVLQDNLAENQTIPCDSDNNRYLLTKTVTMNQAVQDKAAAGKTDDLALYMNIYIANNADPDNLDILDKANNERRIAIQKFDGQTYYETIWYLNDMKLKAGWNSVLLSFALSGPEADGAIPARKQNMKFDWAQIFEVRLTSVADEQKDYDLRISNVMLVDTAFDTEGNSTQIVDPAPPDYQKLQDVVGNQVMSYNASQNLYSLGSKLTFTKEVKRAAEEDLALYMDVYVENPADPETLNFFKNAGGQIALQYMDSSSKYHEVRWLVKNQLAAVNWKKGWNKVLLAFSPSPRDKDAIAPFGTPGLLWDVEQSFQLRFDSLPSTIDFSQFKLRLANVSIVDTSRKASVPETGEMKDPAHRVVGTLNPRNAHLTASNGSYSLEKTGMSIDATGMQWPDMAIFANVYIPDASSVTSASVMLTNDKDQVLAWHPNNLKTGWNQLQLPFSDTPPATADVSVYTDFSFSVIAPAGQDVRLGTAYLVNTKAPYSETQLTLSSAFGDHMLFQRNKPIYVWGYAAKGDTVTVSLYETDGDKLVGQDVVTAGEDNTFTAALCEGKGLPGGYTSYYLTIEDKDAVGVKAAKQYTDVVVGELWLASGQSNMELTVKSDRHSSELLAQAGNANIRYLKERSWPYGDNVQHPLTPNFDIIDTYWDTAANTTRLQNVSSIGYQFALQLQDELDMPVGIISNASGGSRIDCWLSRDAIDGDAEIKAYLQGRKEYYDESNWPLANNRMSTLYNEIMGPIAGFEDGKGLQITGTIWYQGESNLSFNGMYDKFLELLQKDWSRVFGFEDNSMPLIYAHIAPHLYGAYISDQAEDMTRAWKRHSDTMAQVTLYDCPLTYENGDGTLNSVIHPTTKGPVADRYALAALDLVYGADMDATAPVYSSMSITETGRIRVTFDRVGDGLSIIGNEGDLHGFSIAGVDGVFVDARAAIVSEDTVEVWNDRVTQPKYVAYAFGNYVSASNLKNSAGFPAAAFHTDLGGKTPVNYQPQDWQYADGKVWVNYQNGREMASFEDMWGVAEGTATFAYDTTVKAEGKASLKVDYSSSKAAVTPVWGGQIDGKDVTFLSPRKQFQYYNYLTAYLCNPDARPKTLQLTVVSGGKTYTAALADTAATNAEVPASSDFRPYSFNLQKLSDSSGKVAANPAALLQNLTELRFTVVDTQGGTVYLDDIQFGMEEAENTLVDKTALNALIDENLIPADYTAETWATYDAALTAAKTVAADTAATRQAVVNAADALRTAKAALVKAGGPTVKLGDIDGSGDVTAADALMALQAATNKIVLNEQQTKAADVDSKDGVTAADALLILQYATEKISSF